MLEILVFVLHWLHFTDAEVYVWPLNNPDPWISKQVEEKVSCDFAALFLLLLYFLLYSKRLKNVKWSCIRNVVVQGSGERLSPKLHFQVCEDTFIHELPGVVNLKFMSLKQSNDCGCTDCHQWALGYHKRGNSTNFTHREFTFSVV